MTRADQPHQSIRARILQLIDQDHCARPFLPCRFTELDEGLRQVGLERPRVGHTRLGLHIEGNGASRHRGPGRPQEGGGAPLESTGALLVSESPADLASEVDHIVSKAMGGTDDMENLQAICGGPGSCHELKTAEEMGRRVRPKIGADGWPV